MLDSVWTEPQTGAKFELDIKPAMCNRMGNLHGGAAATIFDMCTTIAAAPLAKEGFWDFGGVSRTLSVTYMRPVPVNIKVLVECTVMQIGKRLGESQLCLDRCENHADKFNVSGIDWHHEKKE